MNRTDTELADALVELGILSQYAEDARRGFYVLPGHYQIGGYDVKGVASWALKDWRVAGLCMEDPGFHYAVEQDEGGKYVNAQPLRRSDDGPLTRAIIEAFVEAKRPA